MYPSFYVAGWNSFRVLVPWSLCALFPLRADDGRPHPGPAVVTCYDEGVPFRYPVREGMSFTMENTGGSYGWEKPRATIRVAGSSVSYGLSDYVGRGGD